MFLQLYFRSMKCRKLKEPLALAFVLLSILCFIYKDFFLSLFIAVVVVIELVITCIPIFIGNYFKNVVFVRILNTFIGLLIFLWHWLVLAENGLCLLSNCENISHQHVVVKIVRYGGFRYGYLISFIFKFIISWLVYQRRFTFTKILSIDEAVELLKEKIKRPPRFTLHVKDVNGRIVLSYSKEHCHGKHA